MKPPLEDLASVLEMDKQLDCMRAKLNQQASANAEQGVDGPVRLLPSRPVRRSLTSRISQLIMILIVLNWFVLSFLSVSRPLLIGPFFSLFLNLHHLRVALGLATLPFNPSAPIVLGSAEYSMKRCLEGVHSIHEVRSPLLSRSSR